VKVGLITADPDRVISAGLVRKPLGHLKAALVIHPDADLLEVLDTLSQELDRRQEMREDNTIGCDHPGDIVTGTLGS
jgi:hypothetical protein